MRTVVAIDMPELSRPEDYTRALMAAETMTGGVRGIDIVPPDVGVPVNCAGCVPPAEPLSRLGPTKLCSAVNSITLDIR